MGTLTKKGDSWSQKKSQEEWQTDMRRKEQQVIRAASRE